MITEKGTIKTSVKIDGKVQDELNRNGRILCVVYIIVGAVLSAGGLALCVWEVFKDSDGGFGTLLLTVGLILLFCGIFLIFILNNAKKATGKRERVEHAEFFDDYLIERVYTDGEHTSTNKVYYKWLVKIKETQNFLFLYTTRATAIAVDKNSLPPSELNTVRGLLKRVPKTAPAPNVNKPDKPAEPFADMTENKDDSENKEE